MSSSTLLLTVKPSNTDFKCFGSVKVLMSLQIYAERLKLCVPNSKAICFQEISRLYELCLFFCAVEARKKLYTYGSHSWTCWINTNGKQYFNGWNDSHSTEETPNFLTLSTK